VIKPTKLSCKIISNSFLKEQISKEKKMPFLKGEKTGL
jgi:hypothetical protein